MNAYTLCQIKELKLTYPGSKMMLSLCCHKVFIPNDCSNIHDFNFLQYRLVKFGFSYQFKGNGKNSSQVKCTFEAVTYYCRNIIPSLN